jgi:hypothetical protein
MKKKNASFILNIPTPCHENWDEMTPSEKGRFCNQCSKTVVDFSKMSDKEVIQLITDTNSRICGHVNVKQLDRVFENKPVAVQRTYSPLPQLLSGILLLSTPSCDDVQQIHVKTELSQTDNSFKVGKIKTQPQKHTTSNLISGQILDSLTSEPIQFVEIRIIDGIITILKTYSDENGNFQFEIPKQKESTIRLSIQESHSYPSKEIAINTATELPWKQKIYLQETAYFLEGEVMIIDTSKTKKRNKKQH